VTAAAAVGVRLFAITDHDSLAAYRELLATGVPAELELISGVEINAMARGLTGIDELHVLGFGMDPGNEAFEAALAGQRAARRVRFRRTVDRLREIGLAIDDQLSTLDLTRDDALGRPTIGRALVAAGHAESVEDAFRRYIGWGGPAFFTREGLGPREAIAAIRAGGGLPVMAHFGEAWLHVGLIRELVEAGLGGLEVYYPTFQPSVVESVGEVADALSLVKTGGSDYHGDLMTYEEAHALLSIPDSVGTEVRRALALR
jgi:predicted metal-dependent phosphoesterase TrpH